VKKEIALQLADAITSGHYERTFAANRRVSHVTGENSFCLSGVLINLFAQAHPELAAKETNPLSFMGMNHSLPWVVMNWADVAHGDMGTRDGKPLGLKKSVDMIMIGPYSLQNANDARAFDERDVGPLFVYSWEEIADWLRKGKNHERI